MLLLAMVLWHPNVVYTRITSRVLVFQQFAQHRDQPDLRAVVRHWAGLPDVVRAGHNNFNEQAIVKRRTG